MEIQLNLVLVACLAFAWSTVTASSPRPALDPAEPGVAILAEMEDAFARDPSDLVVAQRLSRTYLELEQPGLAIATLRAGDPRLLEHPMIAHRLAQAYEQSGRVLGAFATADLAVARCGRVLGDAEGPSGTPMPRYGCDARQYALLSTHHRALEHMVEWGVSQPTLDGRSQLAYDLAMRRARIASAE